tara:strand:- start:8200 stop:9519 length:1320 start_codon:yes stop_codon:yes gene_type:complete
MKYDYVILDPASTEFNRGGFCYLPYILYSALKEGGKEVILIEDFTVAELDNLPEAKQYIASLWSYPQMDICFILNKFLDRVSYFGYIPLIENLQLGLFPISEERLKKGLQYYPSYYKDFKYILLSDCDMHLKKYEGIVHPLCTSYGCSNACAFCPSSVNSGWNRVVIPVDTVSLMIDSCVEQGIHNIHFTDEDFFFNADRAFDILNGLIIRETEFNLIALGSSINVERFIERYGVEVLEDSGLKIIEIGFETADEDLTKSMLKPSIGMNRFEKLAKELEGHVDIFWLTLTFFPGETITTLNKTGAFLREYGFDKEEMYGRVRTNSTEGGLGQFFQPYHGTRGFGELGEKGVTISERPVRLVPSYIPDSFLNSGIEKVHREVTQEDKEWFALYKVPDLSKFLTKGIEGYTIRAVCGMSGNHTLADKCVFYAICARLGIIT